MKQYLLLLTALATLQTLNASHSFQVGVAAGLNTLSGKRSDFATNDTPHNADLTKNKGVHSRGMYGGIFAGHLIRFGNFAIGPEFFYNYGKIENTVNCKHEDAGVVVTEFDITHRISAQFGANARVGYFLDSYFLYGLIGVHCQTSNFEVKARQDLGAGTLPTFDYKTEKKTTSVFSFGLGAQKAITENYAIGFECKIAKFPKRTFNFNLNDANEVKLSSTFQYQLRSFALRFLYTF